VIDHIVDVTQRAARLSVRYGQLIVEAADGSGCSVPLADLAVLILANAQISLTQPVLAALLEAGGVCIVCDSGCRPIGLLAPLVQHHQQTQRLAAQARAPLPVRKRLWKQIVRSKIAAQARTLEQVHGEDFGLRRLIPLVRSGDPANVEAQASQRYWRRLFADAHFRRDPDRTDQNRYLNYGYAVLRAMTARALCAAGLHPSLGIHHHRRDNPFCLADDLMEPFRPLVDRRVVELLRHYRPDAEMSPQLKADLLAFLQVRLPLEGEKRTLFDVLARAATSLADVFLKNRRRLLLPDWNHAAE
jgi:CRISPR-associated protein Cas1